MGVTECCAKQSDYEEDAIQGESGSENKRSGRSNYEDWQPSWQNDAIDGEEDFQPRRKQPIKESSRNPQVGDGYNMSIPMQVNRKEELKGLQEELRKGKEALGGEENLLEVKDTAGKKEVKTTSKSDMKISEELKWKQEEERRRQKLQKKKEEPKIQEEVKEEVVVKFQEQQIVENKAQFYKNSTTIPTPAIKKDKKSPEKNTTQKKVTFKLPKSSYAISVVNRDFSDIRVNLRQELTKVTADSKSQAGKDAVPFLIASSLYMDNYALIFSRDFHGLDIFEDIKGFNSMVSSYTLKTLNVASKDKNLIRKQVEDFLSKEGEGSFFAGCINDKIYPLDIHFLFIKTQTKLPACGCIITEATKENNIAEELNKHLEAGKEFRAGLTVYNETFSSAIARLFIYQQTETLREKYEYRLFELTDYDFLNADIMEKEKQGNEFVGVIVGLSFEDSFMVFIRNTY